MSLIGDETPYCRRCEYELDGRRGTCPRCQFSPRDKGLRVALGLLMIVVVSMTVAMILPFIGPLLIRIAALAFLLTLVAFGISFLATPYRLGSLFLRF